MAEKKEKEKEFSTCLENTPFAEMMHRMAGRQGIGSLCAEMMKRVRGEQGEGCRSHCTEMMKSLLKKRDGSKEEAQKTREEEGHGGDQ